MVRRSTRRRRTVVEVGVASPNENDAPTKKIKSEKDSNENENTINKYDTVSEAPKARPKKPSKQRKTKQLKNKGGSDIGTGTRPTQDESRFVTMALSALHPYVADRNNEQRKTMLEGCGMRDSITDAIVSTMLSQNTTDANSKAAFKSLKETFRTDTNTNIWEAVAACEDVSKIENAIRVAGLAKTRSERIRTMLRTVKEERGVASLDYIRGLNDEETKVELSRFKGLGPKTISCVLLFALGRPEFPVDTHVLRITQKMGWVPSSASREGAYHYLNEMIPDDIKMDLHCLLVRHGKCCHKCASNGRPQFPPNDGSKLNCPLVSVNKWSGTVPESILELTKKTYAGISIEDEELSSSANLKRTEVKMERIEEQELPLNAKEEQNIIGVNEISTVKMEPDEIKSEMI